MIIYKLKRIPENMKENGPPIGTIGTIVNYIGTLYSTPTCHANVMVDVS